MNMLAIGVFFLLVKQESSDPYFRFKLFSSAKFNQTKYEEDKDKMIKYYNSLGYRDAQVVADTIVSDTSYGHSKINVNIKVTEGHKYYFGNITWKGNTKYSDSVLTSNLRY